MKLQENYFESEKLSVRLKYSIRRIIGKFCSFEELLNFETTLLKRVDGVKTHQELEKMFIEIKAKKLFEKKVKKALTNN